MYKNTPDTKVGLVTFSDTIKVFGDGSQSMLIFDQSFFSDKELILRNGIAAAASHFTKPIKQSYHDLRSKI
jgi:hypothetical protein